MPDAIPLLICDDSGMARKQLMRALPRGWPFRITQADNGQAGLEAIRAGLGEIVLLDLTMPELDGFEVLRRMREERLQAQVIVISGDVQEEAIRRALELGARSFIRKPADAGQLEQALLALGVHAPTIDPSLPAAELDLPSVGFRDAFREAANIAMGRAAELLARVLGVFIKLPVPNVNILEVAELHMALADAQGNRQVSAICQGYIGSGIAGEALLIFHDSQTSDVARLLKHQSGNSSPLELQLDLAAIVIGACLNGICEQLDLQLSSGHPMVLGQHCTIEELIRVNRNRWKRTLAVEISYALEDHDIKFDLLLLFTEASVQVLQRKTALLIN